VENDTTLQWRAAQATPHPQVQKTSLKALSPKWHKEANRPRGPLLLSTGEGDLLFRLPYLFLFSKEETKAYK